MTVKVLSNLKCTGTILNKSCGDKLTFGPLIIILLLHSSLSLQLILRAPPLDYLWRNQMPSLMITSI